MRVIDMETWSRREHYKFFNAFDHPHFSMSANMDLTKFHPLIKKSGYSVTVAIVYILARAANAIPEFRYRLREASVVEHDIVHPSFTVLGTDDRFGFCYIDYCQDFAQFARRASEQIELATTNLSLENPPGRDDFLFMTSIPWVSFTSFIHPMNLNPADSVPRFAWGKFFEENKRLKMPLEVQAHHVLMDGIHMGRYFITVQDYFDNPETVLG